MKLIHKNWTFEMLFQENTVQRVVIENPKIFTTFIGELQEWLEGADNGWILSEDGKVLKASNCCDLILDYFNLDINQRKMVSYLHSTLETEILDTDLYVQWREVSGNLLQMLEKAIEASGYDVTYSEADIKACLKMLGVSFQKRADSTIERLLEYQKLVNEVLRVKVFILVNTTTYFTQEELRYLYEQAEYRKYYLLLFDTQQIQVCQEKENILIIDNDACIIQENLG